MATTSDITRGLALRHNNEIHVVVDFQFVNPGKGAAFVRTRLKNIKTGKVLEQTYKSGEKIELIDLDRIKVQYLYSDASGYYFMNPQNYEQISLSRDEIGSAEIYLQEGQEAVLLMHDQQPITLELPRKITLQVESTPEGVRGDTASGRVTKEAILKNGLKVQVPLFIGTGDQVIINTETGEYVERA